MRYRSPHTRGDEPLVHMFQHFPEFLVPTRVGMNRRRSRSGGRHWRSPHTRGDEPVWGWAL